MQSQSPPRKATPSRTFLRRGEGIARFGMKIPKIKRKGKPSGSTQARPPDVRLEGSVDGANNQTQHNLLLGKRPPRQSPPRSPSPLPPPPLPRSSPGNPTEQPPVTAWGRSGDETSAGALRPMRVRKVAQSLVWNGDQRNSMESLASVSPITECLGIKWPVLILAMCIMITMLSFPGPTYPGSGRVGSTWPAALLQRGFLPHACRHDG